MHTISANEIIRLLEYGIEKHGNAECHFRTKSGEFLPISQIESWVGHKYEDNPQRIMFSLCETSKHDEDD